MSVNTAFLLELSKGKEKRIIKMYSSRVEDSLDYTYICVNSMINKENSD
jgi:hypothetical protein